MKAAVSFDCCLIRKAHKHTLVLNTICHLEPYTRIMHSVQKTFVDGIYKDITTTFIQIHY